MDKEKRNQWIAAALIGASAVAGGFTVADMNNPELTQIQSITEVIADSQDLYYAKNGIYWQGLPTNDIVPADGQSLTPTKLDRKPHYQNDNWTKLVTLPESLPFQIQVNQYRAPDGDGWWVVYRKKELDQLLERAIGFGPQKEALTYNWKVISEDNSVASTTP